MFTDIFVKIFLALLICLGMVSASAEEVIYQWTDTSGTVHFSDQFNEDASVVTLSELQTYPNKIELLSSSSAHNKEPTKAQYVSVSIVQPVDQEAIHNNQGIVVVKSSVKPKFLPNDSMQLFMDGKPADAPSSKLIWVLKNVDRGAHILKIVILDADQKVLMESKEITFYLHRPSVDASKK